MREEEDAKGWERPPVQTTTTALSNTRPMARARAEGWPPRLSLLVVAPGCGARRHVQGRSLSGSCSGARWQNEGCSVASIPGCSLPHGWRNKGYSGCRAEGATASFLVGRHYRLWSSAACSWLSS